MDIVMDGKDTEERKARRFERGLRAEIRRAIEIMELPTSGVILRKAQILDKTEKPVVVAETKDKGQNSALKRPWNKDSMKRYDNGNEIGKKPKVYGTNKRDVLAYDTCDKNHGGTYHKKTGTCFKCGKTGHFIQNCIDTKEDQERTQKDQIVQGRVYALTMKEAEDAATMVAGTILVSRQLAFTLFDSRATYSSVSSRFARKISGMLVKLESEFSVATPSGEVLNCKEMLKGYAITIAGRELEANLVIMDMYDFDVIQGMDWLSTHRGLVKCFEKEVVFQPPKMLSFLASVFEAKKEGSHMQDIPAVKDYANVFPEDIQGLPTDREIEFAIELLPGMTPISKPPY
ncbi:uncharacterized protein LOC109946469 [Prunus persica]|uniref:uncharacterized protein LOC109946469 n=1 Tax=Prunus persica TaxID=3760 RepID=UPI0009AB6419|nr:uncharacterized protein LOC109946469 [Prunus persica]